MKEQTKASWTAGLFAFVRNVAAFVTAAGIIWVAGQNILGPAVDAWLRDFVAPLQAQIEDNAEAIQEDRAARRQEARITQDLRDAMASIAATQSKMAETLSGAVDRLSELEEVRKKRADPVMRFAANRSAHFIGNGPAGGVVEVTWSVFKMRDDCGRPTVELYFRNGGGRVHRFRNASAIDAEGRGIGLPANPMERQSITYTVEIPGNDGVMPGRAYGWNRVSYRACPHIPPETSPEVPFLILPPADP